MIIRNLVLLCNSFVVLLGGFDCLTNLMNVNSRQKWTSFIPSQISYPSTSFLIILFIATFEAKVNNDILKLIQPTDRLIYFKYAAT